MLYDLEVPDEADEVAEEVPKVTMLARGSRITLHRSSRDPRPQYSDRCSRLYALDYQGRTWRLVCCAESTCTPEKIEPPPQSLFQAF